MSASGKGLTPEQSQASAIMEFAERYSWLHFDYKNYDGYTIKTYNEIKKCKIPTVDDSYFLGHFINLHNKAELLEEIKNIPLKWLKGISLLNQKEFYYPLNWHNYTFTSNGLATGNAIEEAILQAMCEVIERENVYRLFGDQQIPNDVEIKSIRNLMIRLVLENAKHSKIEIKIKNISFDFLIPTFVVYGINKADKHGLTYQGCGYGTHPNPEKALIRALSEYFEGYSLLKKIEKDVHIDWSKIIPRLPEKNFGFLALLRPEMLNKSSKTIQMPDIPDLSQPDIKDEIEHILKIMEKHKYNPILLDKTSHHLKIPVVRIFIPGMRNLMVNETHNPHLIMSAAYYEAGDEKKSKEHLDSYYNNISFYLPEVRLVTPKKAFKKDYKETILFHGGLKQDILDSLKNSIGILKNYRPY
ncbi:MAG: YcaO-like family protein [Candidatus Margulisbacteria bacterium]|nr:YcaO-like family protein [Candidatus Margulisiibacteriota bacterium]